MQTSAPVTLVRASRGHSALAQLPLQPQSLTVGQTLLAAKPPSQLIPMAGCEPPQLKVTSPQRKIPVLYAELSGQAEAAGAAQEVPWAALSCTNSTISGIAATSQLLGAVFQQWELLWCL